MSITPERKQGSSVNMPLNQAIPVSPEVQVAILSERIRNLTDPLGSHKRISTRGAASWSWSASAAVAGLPAAQGCQPLYPL